MPKTAPELSALAVNRLSTPGRFAVGGVNGLYINVVSGRTKSWVLRVVVGCKRQHIGLGSYPTVTLAQAREAAREVHAQIQQGLDPLMDKQSRKSALKASQAAQRTFQQAAMAYIEEHKSSWKNAKHSSQWVNTLTTYAYPKFGEELVSHITQQQVLDVLKPIWRTKNETASRLRGRIEKIFDWCIAQGYRQDSNPAAWKGRLSAILPAPGKVQKTSHHRALPIDEMPQFMLRLARENGMAARALMFAILCASRSGEVRGATWDEFDLKKGVWLVPGARMKAGKDHRVPLSDQALAILKDLPRLEGSQHVFFSVRGGPLSDMALTAVLRRMKVDAVPHGFRSTFRDWVAERTDYAGEMAELALAHVVGNKVEAAYRRGDQFEKRRNMMDSWAIHCNL